MQLLLKIQLSAVMFLQFFIWGAWYVTAGTYLIQKLQFSGTEVGLVYGTTAIAAFISPFISGVIADRFLSVEKLLGGCHLIGGVLLYWVSTVETFSWFYAILLLYSFLFIPTFGLSSALVFHHVKSHARDFSAIRVWGTIGWVIACLIVGTLGWEKTAFPLQLAAAASVLMGIYCLFLPNTPPLQSKSQSLKELLGQEGGSLLRDQAFLVLILGMTIIRIPAAFYYSFVNPYMHELGFTNAAGKMSMGEMSEIFFMLTLPFVLHRLGLKKVILIGMFAWGIRYVLFAFGDGGSFSWMIYSGILLHGIAFNYTALVGQIYIDQTVPAHLRSTAQGFITFITMGFGALAGAFLSGTVVEQYTYPNQLHDWWSIWWFPAGVGLATTLLFAFFFRPRPKIAK